jgi:hypothetical protein
MFVFADLVEQKDLPQVFKNIQSLIHLAQSKKNWKGTQQTKKREMLIINIK